MRADSMLVFAASTQRTIGWVILAIGLAGAMGYWIFNWIGGRSDIGAELELAANKKPYLDDDDLEGKKLDLSLTFGLATLALIGVALPFYWLGEPGRHDGKIADEERQFGDRGGNLYEEACSSCHGLEGVGGVAPYTVTDDNGQFVATVEWKAPALTAVLYRFSEEEVRYTLNFGRQNSPMPAWGAPGGGPLTSQEIDDIILYLERIQLSNDEIAAEVEEGVVDTARLEVVEINPALADADIEDIEAAAIEYVADATAAEYGELLFNNVAAQGAYNCARCHTAGWSWDSDVVAVDPDQPNSELIPLQVSGGGGFGPNLTNGATLRQFSSFGAQVQFIIMGAVDGQPYGNFGQGDGGGQMPAFGECVGDRGLSALRPVSGFCDERAGMLTVEQIEAIVTYERGL